MWPRSIWVLWLSKVWVEHEMPCSTVILRIMIGTRDTRAINWVSESNQFRCIQFLNPVQSKQVAVWLSFSWANLTTLVLCVYCFGIAIQEPTVSTSKHHWIKKIGKWPWINEKSNTVHGNNSHLNLDRLYSSKLSALTIQRMRWDFELL